MSHVMNIMILHGDYEGYRREVSIKDRLNQFFAETMKDSSFEHARFAKAGEDFQVGGSKVWEAATYMIALNHFWDLSGLLEHIQSIDWRNPEWVMVLVQDQNDEQFSLYKFKNDKLTKMETQHGRKIDDGMASHGSS